MTHSIFASSTRLSPRPHTFALARRIGCANVLLAATLALASCDKAALPPREPTPVPSVAQATFGAAAESAVATLEGRFYHAPGRWNACLPERCGTVVSDWGADSLAGALYLRWRFTRDATIVPIMSALALSALTYGSCDLADCKRWSDVPLWDAVADARVFEVTGDRLALRKAQRAFAFVDQSDAYARGACPAIDYQAPAGGANALKTLETDANYIRAALLLRRWTGDPAYLQKAELKYAAVRRYFLDSAVPLYSVYVFDDGRRCAQLPGRYFASINGIMIENGLTLARETGKIPYRRDALETARAVARDLNDGNGVYADLQADNDVGEPLVEAMADLAASGHASFARRWLLAAAAAARAAPTGAYGRFFDGPPPSGPISAWSASGGLALAIAAGALDPAGAAAAADPWANAAYIPDAIGTAPATIAFTGRAIALLGTIGDECCEAGHVRVALDGRETYDRTGIWQNKSPASKRLPGSVLLSWRWPRSGRHTITLLPGIANAKEGGSYIHLTGYELVR